MGLLNMKGTDIDRLGAAQMQEELAQANGQSAASVPQAPQKSFFGRMYERLQDPYYNARVVNALNSLRMRPSASLAASTQATMAEGRQLARQDAAANKTIQFLIDQGRDDLAKLVQENPEYASEAVKVAIGTQHMPKVSAIQTDQQTGQKYFAQYDPNTKTPTRIDIPGAIGETATQKAEREAELARREAGRKAAEVRGRDYFDGAQTINRSMQIMQDARDLAASEDGVVTGVLEQFFPAFDANTQMFLSLQADLGIAVINSATFGALSEAELRLALNKDIPRGLEGQELVEYLDKKIAAQNKLYREMNRKARKLQSGITLGEYMDQMDAEIEENYRILAAYPADDPNMTYELWSQLSGADRKAYLEAEE